MFQTVSKMVALLAALAVIASFVLEQKTIGENGSAPAPVAAPKPVSGIARSSEPLLTAALVQQPSTAARGTEVLSANSRGHFAATLEVNGAPIHMLVDTGATMIAFSAEDAELAGIRPLPADFKHRSATANGEVAIALVKVASIRLGSIELRDVDAAVLPAGALQGTLLGMSFLKRLSLFQFENGRLILRQ
ncbi:MAG: TIGR02281 family clan AA aspartic protease [Beijerinckiaceae bacterium]|nr:TIGR02281 family clan AA aspartic protease [Beijerinckiaceae bacterium]